MIYIITGILLGVGCMGCVIWSNLTKSKTLEIILMTISVMCLIFFFVVIGFTATLPERDTAEAAKIETSEGEQILEIIPADTGVSITIPETVTTEDIIKAFIEKWNGVLPETINITIGGSDELP